ncbi:hypothetical protein ECDEC1E_3596 [Escherichia coli DEC1E]|nr:hypothetical protein ECDEC1E_3596 [Escherichia coli DEC1E]
MACRLAILSASHNPAPSENISQTTYFARRRVAFSAIRQKKVAAL